MVRLLYNLDPKAMSGQSGQGLTEEGEAILTWTVDRIVEI